MDEAIDSLRLDVSPEQQDEIARAVMGLTGKDRSVDSLILDERTDLDAAGAER